MSEEVVQFVIGRAVTDPEYRELLFKNPDEALDGYELSNEEVESLKQFEREKFEENLPELEERISRAGFSMLSFRSMPKPGMLRNMNLGVGATFPGCTNNC